MSCLPIIVLGAGPIGLETASAIMRTGRTVIVLDAGPIGATIWNQFPPATRFFSSPDRIEIAGCSLTSAGQEKTSREDYLAYLRSVVDTLGIDVRTFHEVQRIDRGADCFTLHISTRSGATCQLQGEAVVFATGGTARPRSLDVPGEQLAHVRHDLGDPHQYHGRRVLIVGGRNSACESALRCWRAGAEVHISYRGHELHERVKYWIRPELASLIDEDRVHGHFRTELVEITPEITRLRDGTTGELTALHIDDVLLQIGYEHDGRLMDSIGIERTGPDEAPHFNPDSMETNVNGAYVAGTATAGTQKRFRVFIENCHIHAARIAAALAGDAPPKTSALRSLEEN
ncbi:MAG: NAD(P)-binding domain-containing protein [Phycisphaerales bacterium]|nr:NAD(P)-binding domain-containing protein [Phycisphaerales bacterium]